MLPIETYIDVSSILICIHATYRYTMNIYVYIVSISIQYTYKYTMYITIMCTYIMIPLATTS